MLARVCVFPRSKTTAVIFYKSNSPEYKTNVAARHVACCWMSVWLLSDWAANPISHSPEAGCLWVGTLATERGLSGGV